MVTAEEKKRAFVLKDWLRDYWIYLVIYAFFLYVSTTSVKSGDDWEVESWYKEGFLMNIGVMVRALFYFNGRLANNIFTPFFGYYDLLWCFTAPAIFTSIIYLSGKLFGFTHNLVPITVSFLMMLWVSDDIRLQTYTALTNNVGYIFVIALIFLYLNIIYNENTDKRLRFWQHEKLNYLLVTLLAFIIGLWIENTTIGFVAANILLALLSYINYKKVSPYILYGLIGSILSCLVIFEAPGYTARFSLMGVGAELGISQRIIRNLPTILQYLVIDNLPIYLVFFIIFIASILTGKINSKWKIFRVLAVIFASVMAAIISARMFFELLTGAYFSIPWPIIGSIFNGINRTIFDVNKPIPIVFCFAILLFVPIVAFLSQQKEKLLVLYCIGLVSAGVMAGSPYTPARTITLAIFMLVSITAHFASTIKIKSIDLRKASILVLILATLLQMDKFFLYGTYAMKIDKIRTQLTDSYRANLANGIVTEEEWFALPAFMEGSVFGSVNPSVNNMIALRRHYDLPKDVNLIIDNGFAVKSFSVTQVKDALYRIEVTPLYDISEYTYTFYVQQNNITIYESDEKADNFDNYEFPTSGTYTISCTLSNETNIKKSVSAFEPVEIKAE